MKHNIINEVGVWQLKHQLWCHTLLVALLFSKISTTAVRILTDAPKSPGSRDLFCGSVARMSFWIAPAAALICSSGSRLLEVMLAYYYVHSPYYLCTITLSHKTYQHFFELNKLTRGTV